MDTTFDEMPENRFEGDGPTPVPGRRVRKMVIEMAEYRPCHAVLPVFLATLAWATPSVAGPIGPGFSSFYVLGDSLSDTGNLFNDTAGTDPRSPPYFAGRFSNGPVWVEYVADALDVDPRLVTELPPRGGARPGVPQDGINFAYGGATTGTFNVANASHRETFPGLLTQADLLQAEMRERGARVPQDALASVWAGGNDYLFGLAASPQEPVANIAETVAVAHGLGARTVLVGNLPNLAQTPLGRTLSSEDAFDLAQLTMAHNRMLEETMARLEATRIGLDIVLIDAYALFADAVRNPAARGFTNVTDGCLLVGCVDPSDFLFFDAIHPTTTAHRMIAADVLDSLRQPVPVPEPSSLAALAIGVAGVIWCRRRPHVPGTAPG